MLVSKLLQSQKPDHNAMRHSVSEADAPISQPDFHCRGSSQHAVSKIWTIDELEKMPVQLLTFPLILVSTSFPSLVSLQVTYEDNC